MCVLLISSGDSSSGGGTKGGSISFSLSLSSSDLGPCHPPSAETGAAVSSTSFSFYFSASGSGAGAKSVSGFPSGKSGWDD